MDWHLVFISSGLEKLLSASLAVPGGGGGFLGCAASPGRVSLGRTPAPGAQWARLGSPAAAAGPALPRLVASSSQPRHTPAVRRSQKAWRPGSWWALSRGPSSTLFMSFSSESKSGSKAQCRPQERAVTGATDVEAGSRPLTILPTTSTTGWAALHAFLCRGWAALSGRGRTRSRRGWA